MIVFAGFMPHNPTLLQDKKLFTSPTGTAINSLASKLNEHNIETLVVISSHAGIFEKKYTLEFATHYTPALKKFGIIDTGIVYKADVPLIGAMQSYTRHAKLPLQHLAKTELDYGTSVALKLLNFDREKIQLVVIGTSDRSIVDHMEMGYALKDILHNSTKRIGILITADCSRRHTSDSPAGFSNNAAPFDMDIKNIIENRSIAGLTRIVHDAHEPDECVTHPLALSFGMLRRFPVQSKILSYEVRNGVGLIAATLFIE